LTDLTWSQTTVGIYHYAIFRNPDYFVDVDEFIPERWIGTEGRFANDKRGVVQPFSFGPRNCIGRK
jgi:cytochrome P450